MEVKLTEKQLTILAKISQEKLQLQQAYQNVTQRESDLITMLAESAGYILSPATVVTPKEGGVLEFKEREPSQVDKSISEQPKTKKAKTK